MSKKPQDFIEKLFEPSGTAAKKGKPVMVVGARLESSAEVDAEEAAEREAEKNRWPIAFWDMESDELEPLLHSDLKKLETLGVTPWEWEVIVTEDHLELMKQRESDNG